MGYVRTFLARIGEEGLTVAANDFRNWIGNTQMRSTRVQRIRKRANGVEFMGQGSGHGVGLCQWGARLQAEKGRDYERILEFYFPKATLSVIDE
jgi:stage II sporulation protein D